MATSAPRPDALTVAFAVLGVVLLGLGILQVAWWSLFGGVSALAAAVWRATDLPEDPA